MAKATDHRLEQDREVAESETRAALGTKVRGHVIAALGQPPGLFDVAVRRLWDGHYRVNVLIGPEPTNVRIVHSYFVRAAGNGEIVSSTPKIARLYP